MDINLPLITKAKITLTNSCQLRCKYCYENHDHSHMTLDNAKSAIELILNNGKQTNVTPQISFFGGEPLLVYDELLKPCIEYVRDTLKSRCILSFTTNGLLLDEDKLKFFRSKNVQFMLSIDGCEEAHDKNRVYSNGEGSFSDLEPVIEKILKYYPNTKARMTVTPENVEYLYDSIRYLSEKGFRDVHIIPDLFIVSGWKDSDFDILRSELSLIESYIIDTFEEGEIPLVFDTLADMFTRIVLSQYCQSMHKRRTADCYSPLHRCGIGTTQGVSIDAKGNIFSCLHGSTEPSESNVLYLGDIRKGISEERRLSLLKMNECEITSQRADCNKCPLDLICTGGCVPNNYSVTGEFTIVPEAYCKWSVALYESARRIIEYFDSRKDNLLFKDYFYGVVKRGVSCVC